MKAKGLSRMCLVALIIIGAIISGFIMKSVTANPTEVYVDPAINSSSVGQQFTVDIKISGVTDLWGWGFVLYYNTAVLNASAVEEGSFLSQNGTYLTKFTVTKGTGWNARIVSCTINGNDSVSGSGTLASVTFLVLKEGYTRISLRKNLSTPPESSGLGTSEGADIPHTTIGGFFSNVRDIAVLDVTAYPTEVSVGEPVFINVTVKNQGNETETFSVATYYDNTTIENQTVTNMNPGTETTLIIIWDTAGVDNNTYTVNANASILEGEFDTTNNYDLFPPTVTLTLAPAAIFTYSPVEPLVGETVTFNATASFAPTGYITSYKWNFGDGNVTVIGDDEPITPIMTHVYTSAGYYFMNLTVTDNDNKTGTRSKTIPVGKPIANFTFTPDSPIVGQTVTFNASLSEPRGGDITNYTWNFGDNMPVVVETDPVVTHTYTTQGTYTVTLNVTDSEGMWDTESATITVRVRVLAPPVAAFTFTPTSPAVGDTVTFNATASSDSDGNIVSYKWDFGDGNRTTVTTPTITHTYKASGTYTVTLTVTDNDDLTDAETKNITVEEAPSNNILYLAVAIVIAIIIIAAIAIYFLKVRKPS